MTPPETPHTDVDHPNIPQFSKGDRLRKAREHAGIAAGGMASHLGVSRQTISNYENDHVRVDRRTLISWAFVTGVPIDWIEHGDQPVRSAGDRRHEQTPYKGKDRRTSADTGSLSCWSVTGGTFVHPSLLGGSPLPDTGTKQTVGERRRRFTAVHSSPANRSRTARSAAGARKARGTELAIRTGAAV